MEGVFDPCGILHAEQTQPPHIYSKPLQGMDPGKQGQHPQASAPYRHGMIVTKLVAGRRERRRDGGKEGCEKLFAVAQWAGMAFPPRHVRRHIPTPLCSTTPETLHDRGSINNPFKRGHRAHTFVYRGFAPVMGLCLPRDEKLASHAMRERGGRVAK